MKAACLTGIEKVTILERPVPDPGPGEVLVRVKKVGICGSDVHYFRSGRIGDQVIVPPFTIGHEAAGEVAKAGAGVTGLEAGQPVAIEPAISCGQCEVCQRGRPNLCAGVRFLGTPPIEGAYREYLVMPAANLFPLPKGLSLEEGALAEPLAVGLYAVNRARITPGETVAVFGCGPIGLSLILAARLAGAAVLASEPLPARRDFALKLGADRVFDPGALNPVDGIMKATGGRGVDAAFEAAGQPDALRQAIETAALGARVVMVGIPAEDDWQIPSHLARRKELDLLNIRRSAFCAEKIIRLMESGRLKTAGLVTHHFRLEELAEGLKLVAGYGDGVIKAVIEI